MRPPHRLPVAQQPHVNVIIQATSQVAATLQQMQQQVQQAGSAIQQTIGAAFNATGATAAFQKLDQEALQLAKVIGGIQFPDFNIEENPIIQTFERIRGLATNNEVLKTVFAFNELAEAGHVVEAAFRPVFEGLIAQNIELRQQILSTAATLAQSQTLKIGSQDVTDPVAKIKAQSEEVSKQINVLRKDALDLAGVTSTELVSSFQTLAQQSATLGLNLQQDEKTTIALTAASTTLGLTGQQREQEIQGIARGEITVYNQLAKSLGINNEIIRQKAAEGRLYQFIQDKTEALRKAQSLAADGFSGLTSNIEEIVQLLSQLAGAPLLDGLLTVIREVYKTLKDNYDGLEELTKGVADFFTQVGTQIEGIAKTLAPALQPFAEAVGEVLLASLQTLGGLLTDTLSIVQSLATAFVPLLQALGDAAKAFADIVSSPFGQTFIEIAVALTAGVVAATNLARAYVFLRESIIAAGVAQAGFDLILGGEGAVKLAGFATKIGNLGGFLSKIGLLGGTVAPALGKIAQGLTGISVAAEAGTLTLPVLAGELTTLAAPLLVVLAPFVALAAVIAGIAWLKSAKDAQNYAEAIENTSVGTNDLADKTLKTASSLKVLNSVEKERGTLTATQELQRNRLIKAAQQEQQGIDAQIVQIKKLVEAFGDQNGSAEKQIQLLEKRKELLGAQIPVKTENVAIEDKGSEVTQLADKVAAFRRDLEKPLNQDKLIAASKETIELTKRQLELGTITRDEAVKRFTEIANLRGQDQKTAESAQKAIGEAEKQQLERKSEDLKASLAETEAAVQTGKVGEIAGAEQVTARKKELLDLQFKSLQEEKAAEDALREKSTAHDLEIANKAILDARDNLAKAQQGGDKDAVTAASKDLEAANKKKQEVLTAGNEAQLEAERQFGDKAKELQAKRDTEAIDGARRVAAARTAVANREETQALDAIQAKKADRDDELIAKAKKGAETTKQLQAEENQGRLQDIRDEIAAEQKKATELAAIPDSNNPADQEKKEKAIRDNALKTHKLKLSLIETENDQKRKAVDLEVQKTEDAVAQSKADRELKLDRQIASGTANRDKLRAEANKNAITDIQAEIAAEKQKTEAIKSLGKGTPEENEKNEKALRDSKRKTTELAIKLIDEELAQRKRAIDEQLLRQRNQLTAQEVPLKRQADLSDLYVKSLETQQRLLSAKTALLQSINTLQQGEYSLAIKLAGAQDVRRQRELERRDAELKFLTATTDEEAEQARAGLEKLDNEDRQRKLQLEAALAKQASLERSQKFELESAELEERKTIALQEQAELKLKIEALDAKIATADAVGEVAKLKVDKTATQGQLDAAQQKVDLNKQKEALIEDKQKLLPEDRAAAQQEAAAKKQSILDKQQLERDEAAGSIAELDPSGRSAQQQSRTAQGRAQQQTARLQRFDQPDGATAPTPIGFQQAGAIVQVGGSPQQEELLTQIRDGIAAQKAAQPANATINNYFTGAADKAAVQDASQQTLTTLKRVLNLAGATGGG